jgi:hypothetical protein
MGLGCPAPSCGPPRRRWVIQAAGWVTCVVTARLSVGATVLSTLRLMAELARGLDTAFAGQPDAELLTVMVGIPMLLNVGQAWIQDQVRRGVGERLALGWALLGESPYPFRIKRRPRVATKRGAKLRGLGAWRSKDAG